MQKMKQLININKILIIVIILIVIIASCIITVTITKVINKNNSLQNKLLEYQIIKRIEEGRYEILITIKDEKEIEYVKCPNGNALYPLNKNIVGIDYEILTEIKYDFTIKLKNEDEVVETIYMEIPKIKGKYENVNGIYLNIPDLTGYVPKYTRYMEINEKGYMTPGNWITSEPSKNWYSYKESKWANICVETNGLTTYYVWIPRYCFKLNYETQRSDVKFIDTSNNYIDEEGNTTTWDKLQEQGYQVPEAFEFNDIRIPGYWAMKYTVGDVTIPSIINYEMSVSKGNITIKNITLNTSITNLNPIEKYTIALNGEIIKEITNNDEITTISSQIFQFSNLKEGENSINITGLNANGEIVGSMTKQYLPAVVNKPDLTGFNPETTFYVTYDENDAEHSTIPITNEAPKDWYEYGESRWANIVTRNNELETYYTWIPRYEFRLDQVNQRSDVRFIEGTSTKTSEGYQIPEAFTFNGEEISGYWAMKYTIGDAAAPKFDTEVVATSKSIRTKGITGTAKADGQVYKYYINGEYKGETTNSSENFEYSGLESKTKYTILVEIRNNETNEYLGTIVKQITTIEANKPELTGFNEECTYYVLYDEEGNENIGENIKNDASNMPNNWYDYSKSKWANVVVKGNGTTTYYTWIPRYEFMITSSQYAQPAQGRTEVRFIEGTSTETTPEYQIPEAFTFNGKEIPGYWVTKYTIGE